MFNKKVKRYKFLLVSFFFSSALFLLILFITSFIFEAEVRKLDNESNDVSALFCYDDIYVVFENGYCAKKPFSLLKGRPIFNSELDEIKISSSSLKPPRYCNNVIKNGKKLNDDQAYIQRIIMNDSELASINNWYCLTLNS